MLKSERELENLLEKIAPDRFAAINDLEQAAREALELVGPPGAALAWNGADIASQNGPGNATR